MSDSVTRPTEPFLDTAKLTGEELRNLFSEAKIVRDRRHKPPSNAAFSELARRIRTVHSKVLLQRGAWKLSVEQTKQANAALQSLAEVLPKMLSDVREGTLDLGPTGVRQYFLTECGGDLRALNSLIPPIQKALSRSLDMIPQIFPRTEQWHDFVFDLTNAFCDAMQSTNPKVVLPMANEGAIARFLVAIIPHISGENPKPNAVARYVTRNSAPKITLREGGITVPWPKTRV